MTFVKVTRRYQVTLPADVRTGIRVGDTLAVVRVGDGILLRPLGPKRSEEALWGLGRDLWREIDAVEYVSQLRQGWEASGPRGAAERKRK